jgi:hypothetical protein
MNYINTNNSLTSITPRKITEPFLHNRVGVLGMAAPSKYMAGVLGGGSPLTAAPPYEIRLVAIVALTIYSEFSVTIIYSPSTL